MLSWCDYFKWDGLRVDSGFSAQASRSDHRHHLVNFALIIFAFYLCWNFFAANVWMMSCRWTMWLQRILVCRMINSENINSLFHRIKSVDIWTKQKMCECLNSSSLPTSNILAPIKVLFRCSLVVVKTLCLQPCCLKFVHPFPTANIPSESNDAS